jgi:hypothetical protein
MNKFFDKNFLIIFFIIIALEILSLLVYSNQLLNSIVFGLILFIVLILSLIDLRYGVLSVFIELAIGSYGYLFSLDIIDELGFPIRIGIFLIFGSVWVFRVLQKKRNFDFLKNKYLSYYLILFVFILLGFSLAFIYGNQKSNIFFDINGYFFFLLIFPFLDSIRSFHDLSVIIKGIIAAIAAQSLKVLFLFYAFSYKFLYFTDYLYQWVRDTRIGEITKMDNNFYRIFFQSQLYNLVVFFIICIFLMGGYFLIKNSKKIVKKQDFIYFYVIFVLSFISIVISMSRSFWVGAAVAVFALGSLFLYFYSFKLYLIKIFFINCLFLVFVSIIMLVVPMQFTFSSNQNISSALDTIKHRSKLINTEAGISSRWSLLPALLKRIKKHRFLGAGFGSVITYKSSDPRILSSTAGNRGQYTTFAFEWGYLDIWLKIGIFGLMAYLFLILVLFYDGLKYNVKLLKNLNFLNRSKDNNVINYDLLLKSSLFYGLLLLSITNVFSPYLNHPLGIGLILLITIAYAIAPNKSV